MLKENAVKIQTDKEGWEAIQQLCNIALKVGGLDNMPAVTTILQAVKEIPKEKSESKGDTTKQEK